jgi:Carboxypeptidase regulatory-like domain
MRKIYASILMGLVTAGGVITLTAQEQARRSRIQGIVVNGHTGAPLPGVRVRLTPGPIITETDENGRFVIEGLPAGVYRLNTERVGYLSGRLPGRRLSISGGIPLMVSPGGALEQAVQLFRAPVVSGRVIDSQGRPVRSAKVIPYRSAFTDSGTIGRKYSPAVTTNDLGEFRATVDDAGQYSVQVWPPMVAGQDTNILFHPSHERELRDDDVLFTLETGTEVRLPVVVLREAAGGRLKLRLQGNVQQQGNALIYLRRRGEPSSSQLTATISAGTCDLPRLAPGVYEVELRLAMGNGLGQATVEIEDHDVVVDLRVKRRVDVVGRVVLDEATPGESVHPVPGVQLRFSDPSSLLNANPVLTSRNDGSFGSAGLPIVLFPGMYTLNVSNIPSGTYVAATVAGDQNLLTRPLEIRDGTPPMIQVHLRRPAASIKGTVRSEIGTPALGAIVALIPDDITQHHLFRVTMADAQGAFEMEAAPGQYTLYSWLELDGPAYRNPQFMSGYQSKGQRVVLRAAEQMQIELKAIAQ